MSEQAWNFERPEDDIRKGKDLWSLEVSAEKIRRAVDPLRTAVEKLKGLAMTNDTERGPDDFAPPKDFETNRLFLELMARHGRGYQENGKYLMTVIVTCTASLIVAGIIATVSMSRDLATIQAQQISTQSQISEGQRTMQRQIDELSRRITRIEDRR